jgi:poly(A) polymerase
LTAPVIIPASEHNISRDQISPGALKVLNGLKQAGFDSYLVGGCVRDLLLGREPKDFDVVTDAPPETIRKTFRSARLIGRRFRLVHVRMGREIIEVATYRAAAGDSVSSDLQSEDGLLLRDNVYGTREEDALRRDFTVNALYFNAHDYSIVDYVNGVEDLRRGVLRVIGDPDMRYREDPVRMLRAVRFAAKLGFRIDPRAEAPIPECGRLLEAVPAARMFEEVLKLFHGGAALQTFELLRHYDLFRYLFPLAEQSLAHEHNRFPAVLIPRALANTDQRVNQGKPVTPAFLFAALLWYPMVERAGELEAQGRRPAEARAVAIAEVLHAQHLSTTIPRRFSGPAREIWMLQGRLERRRGKQAFALMEHARFRAAYDFLLLRAEVGEADPELAQWWTRFQEVDAAERKSMVAALSPSGGGRRRRPRRRKSS